MYTYKNKQTKILELRKEDRVRANPLRAVRMGVVWDRNHVRGAGGERSHKWDLGEHHLVRLRGIRKEEPEKNNSFMDAKRERSVVLN